MNKRTLFIFALFMSSCNVGTQEADTAAVHVLTEQDIAQNTFQEIKHALDQNKNGFWSENLYGPILLINPETRAFYANQNDLTASFDKNGLVYTGTFPKDRNIANTAILWNDIRWTIVMFPLPKQESARKNLLIHELFHRIQPSIGFDKLQEASNGHLDSYEGRLLLKLELEALKQAINDTNATTRASHIENALSFRHKRHTSDNIKFAENTLELNEGLAEYTGVILSGRDDEELKAHFHNNINQFYKNPTYVRSFAYQTIPTYGYLLATQDQGQHKNWHKHITKETNLTDYFTTAFGVDIDENINLETSSLENNYNYEAIVLQEKARETQKLAEISAYKDMFLNKPVLELRFENMNISFDPRNIVPIDDIGTVYPTMRITDNWGILIVENGALLSANWSNVKVTQPTQITQNLVEGDGWKLELAPNWKVEQHGTTYTLNKP